MITAYGLKLTPDTKDEEGVVYTQLITVRVNSGLKFTIFDPRMLCDSNDIDKLRGFNVNVPISRSIEYNDVPDFFIKPHFDTSGFILPSADLSGTIKDITWSFKNEKFPYAVLDIGIGTIMVMLDKIGEGLIYNNKDRLHIYGVGDNIIIKSGQLYLYEIKRES